MPLYKHPTVVDGVMSRGAEQFAVRAGVVDCPQDLGAGLHFGFPSARDVQMYENHPDTKKARAAAAAAEKAKQPPAQTAEEAVHEALLKVLDGNVDDIKTAVAALSADQCAELEKAEQDGKKRKGVLDALDARVTELAK